MNTRKSFDGIDLTSKDSTGRTPLQATVERLLDPGQSQAELAGELGISRQAVGIRLRSGNPNLQSIIEFAHLLGVRPFELVREVLWRAEGLELVNGLPLEQLDEACSEHPYAQRVALPVPALEGMFGMLAGATYSAYIALEAELADWIKQIKAIQWHTARADQYFGIGDTERVTNHHDHTDAAIDGVQMVPRAAQAAHVHAAELAALLGRFYRLIGASVLGDDLANKIADMHAACTRRADTVRSRIGKAREDKRIMRHPQARRQLAAALDPAAVPELADFALQADPVNPRVDTPEPVEHVEHVDGHELTGAITLSKCDGLTSGVLRPEVALVVEHLEGTEPEAGTAGAHVLEALTVRRADRAPLLESMQVYLARFYGWQRAGICLAAAASFCEVADNLHNELDDAGAARLRTAAYELHALAVATGDSLEEQTGEAEADAAAAGASKPPRVSAELTENEAELLQSILHADHLDGQPPVDHAVWLEEVASRTDLRGKSLSGVCSSLDRKGFASTWENDPGEYCIELTLEGARALVRSEILTPCERIELARGNNDEPLEGLECTPETLADLYPLDHLCGALRSARWFDDLCALLNAIDVSLQRTPELEGQVALDVLEGHELPAWGAAAIRHAAEGCSQWIHRDEARYPEAWFVTDKGAGPEGGPEGTDDEAELEAAAAPHLEAIPVQRRKAFLFGFRLGYCGLPWREIESEYKRADYQRTAVEGASRGKGARAALDAGADAVAEAERLAAGATLAGPVAGMLVRISQGGEAPQQLTEAETAAVAELERKGLITVGLHDPESGRNLLLLTDRAEAWLQGLKAELAREFVPEFSQEIHAKMPGDEPDAGGDL